MIVAVLRSLVWLFLIIGLGLGSTFIVANAVVNAQMNSQRPIVMRDSLGIGSHSLSGTILLASSCDEVIVSTEQISTTSYAIRFKTWREPSVVSCDTTGTSAREFHAIVFAPSFGVEFTATINDISVPVAVIPDIPLRQ